MLDLIRIDVKLLRQFDQGLLSLDRRRGHVSLESRHVIPAWSSAHCRLLASRKSCRRCPLWQRSYPSL